MDEKQVAAWREQVAVLERMVEELRARMAQFRAERRKDVISRTIQGREAPK